MKISLTQPTFVHGEACKITGVAPMTLLNWSQRDNPGERVPGTVVGGRRLYSIIDLIRVAIVANLASYLKMGPAFGLNVADMVEPRASEIAALDENGELKYRGYHGDESPHYLIAFAIPGTDTFKVARVAEKDLIRALAVPHPVVVVPLDEIALTITLKCLRHLDGERPAE